VLIIDRFEGDWAVLEWTGPNKHDPVTFNVPRALLPQQAREGDVLAADFTVDRHATDERRQRIKSLEEELFRD